jgi:hypothetical protein
MNFNMTKQELDKYEELQDLFQTRCETICQILRPLKYAYEFVYNFEAEYERLKQIYG